MNKIRLIFIISVLLIFALSLVFLTNLHVPLDTKIPTISEFKITRISGNRALYTDKKPVTPAAMFPANIVKTREMQHSEEMYLKTDPQTAFEFYCFGTAFTALPGAHLYYQPKTQEICVYRGEYYWEKAAKNHKVDIFIGRENETQGEGSRGIVTLSDSGRMRVDEKKVTIWNYAGSLKFNLDNREVEVKSRQVIVLDADGKTRVTDILPPPEFISPDHTVIVVGKPSDSFVRFSWKAVRGAKNYIFRLYSSALKENLLEEMVLAGNRKSINLQHYGNFQEFYWVVLPFDKENTIEGVPSQTGYVKLNGDLEEVGDVVTPPRLFITSLTVSGNMVLIKGEADSDSQLFINDKPVTVNLDGTFIETLNFSSIGEKTIHFRLVAPTELETNITRKITIFDE